MGKFKKGDIVRVLPAEDKMYIRDYDTYIGREFVVLGTTVGGSITLKGASPDGSDLDPWYFSPTMLEMVEKFDANGIDGILTADEIEECFPDSDLMTLDPYWEKAQYTQWLHEFARNIEAAVSGKYGD